MTKKPQTSKDAAEKVVNVCRQSFWNQMRLKLRESLAHLIGLIMQRVACDASAAFRVSFV
jgi:hypothetical protein